MSQLPPPRSSSNAPTSFQFSTSQQQHRPTRRSMKHPHHALSANASSSSTTMSKKIIIRPYQKPPQLPINYYNDTSKLLLQDTMVALLSMQGNNTTKTNNKNTTTTTTTTTTTSLSLQNAYQACSNLVTHQLGPQLYNDLVRTLHQIAIQLVPDEQVQMAHQQNKLLHYMVQQYQIYTNYLNCMKHICLPLDSNYQWIWSEQKAIASTNNTNITTATTTTTIKGNHTHNQTIHLTDTTQPATHSRPSKTSTTTTFTNTTPPTPSTTGTTSASSASTTMSQRLWPTGLHVFLQRLQELQLDVLLYRQWLEQFWMDWIGPNSNSSSSFFSSSSPSSSVSPPNRATLQSIWYMFQDLGIVQHLPLLHDLEEYWADCCRQWQIKNIMSSSTTSSSTTNTHTTTTSTTTKGSMEDYPMMDFLQFCYNKHRQCLVWRTWLPTVWLWTILDQQLVAPHLNTDYLLKPNHLYPILKEQLRVGNSSNSNTYSSSGMRSTTVNTNNNSTTTTTNTIETPTTSVSTNVPPMTLTTVQQLWMLAGRIPGGQAQVAAAIQNFARQEGLCIVRRGSGSDHAIPPLSHKPVSAIENYSTVQELLQLQESLQIMIQELPGATATTTSLSSKGPSASYATGSMQQQHQQYQSPIISLKSVWEEVVNVDSTPSLAEQLAKFLDQILRSNKKMDQYSTSSMLGSTGGGGGGDNTMTWLNRIIAGLFIPLQAKDVFEAFYKRDLAKRLLWNRVVSMDVEKQVCSLLKAECGAGYTSKMEGMFQDVDWSRETMLVYKQSLAGGGIGASSTTNQQQQQHFSSVLIPLPVEVEVQVLTTGYWPVYPQYPNLQLPDSLKQPQDQFANHYKTKYQGRRMTWQYALGHCVVRVNGFSKPYELIVSLCQALVLIQFDSTTTSWTLPQLLHATGLEDRNEMERILQSLALGKDGTRILRKMDHDAVNGAKKKTRMNTDDRDTFVVNRNFTSNSRRIRITNVMMKETKDERDKTVEGVSRDRLYLIDAVLVRILKARKTVLHQTLIPQVLEQVKFPVQPADVKLRIESLIEREYLERDTKDRNRYNYLA